MTIICETSAILNSCCAAIISIEIAACYDTCFARAQRNKTNKNNQ